VKASGKGDWNGAIEHKRAAASALARENTVKVIKGVKADVACVVEVENRPLLHSFNRELLGTRKFDFSMVIDGNDPRGIDVGLLSKFPIHGIWSHIFDGTAQSRTFSRDCLEVEVELPSGQMMYTLCNHLKSRGYGSQAANDARRERQAEALRDILGHYNLASDWVVVAGDMNDSPTRPPKVLRHFLDLPNLFDVLELQFPGNVDARWTYHYNAFEQIDYLLVSKPLKQKFVAAGVERRGIHKLKTLTQNAGGGIPVETEYPTVRTGPTPPPIMARCGRSLTCERRNRSSGAKADANKFSPASSNSTKNVTMKSFWRARRHRRAQRKMRRI
jgi:endonuclease/exonuclease/phosphatase family metal-dependent hydrolase